MVWDPTSSDVVASNNQAEVIFTETKFLAHANIGLTDMASANSS